MLQMVRRLIEAGAAVDTPCEYNAVEGPQTPADIAKKHGHAAVAALLRNPPALPQAVQAVPVPEDASGDGRFCAGSSTERGAAAVAAAAPVAAATPAPAPSSCGGRSSTSDDDDEQPQESTRQSTPHTEHAHNEAPPATLMPPVTLGLATQSGRSGIV